ncbi:hypothetical protein J6590_054225 [Homalodisca vitripennis]|nr:hypothetical protein J6590_054225 [Homalodisca vitripennis]
MSSLFSLTTTLTQFSPQQLLLGELAVCDVVTRVQQDSTPQVTLGSTRGPTSLPESQAAYLRYDRSTRGPKSLSESQAAYLMFNRSTRGPASLRESQVAYLRFDRFSRWSTSLPEI